VGVFFKGFIAGLIFCLALVLSVLVIGFFYGRDKSFLRDMEVRRELQILREDYSGRNADSFLDGDAAVRGAADAGIERFKQRRDGVLRRIGGGGNDK
jgi:hypothetical protein